MCVSYGLLHSTYGQSHSLRCSKNKPSGHVSAGLENILARRCVNPSQTRSRWRCLPPFHTRSGPVY